MKIEPSSTTGLEKQIIVWAAGINRARFQQSRGLFYPLVRRNKIPTYWLPLDYSVGRNLRKC
ncbi:MAG: hypothetical protein KC944_24400, partial [Candidatus Omnitrophica bacterium]|nr:hypothetical protein [Candidatus Omnitrophota bacterium]